MNWLAPPAIIPRSRYECLSRKEPQGERHTVRDKRDEHGKRVDDVVCSRGKREKQDEKRSRNQQADGVNRQIDAWMDAREFVSERKTAIAGECCDLGSHRNKHTGTTEGGEGSENKKECGSGCRATVLVYQKEERVFSVFR